MDNASREAKQARLRQIIQMRWAHRAESDWSATLGEASRSLGVRPAARLCSNLSDPAEYLDFFGQTLDYAAFPHKFKHYVALGSDISTKSKAWEWICEQITADALQPVRIHRHLID